MTSQNQLTVKLHIPSELGYEKVAMAAVAIVAQRMGFAEEKVEDLKTAVSEACTNAIEHGNSLDGQTHVIVALTFDRTFIQVKVIDSGRTPLPQSIPDQINPLISGRPDFRGMGLFLIKMLMDKIELSSSPGRNEVQMTCFNPAYGA
jgi:serine/threonine-protein kinase RsbW